MFHCLTTNDMSGGSNHKISGFSSSHLVCSDVTGWGLPTGDSFMTSSVNNVGEPQRTVLEIRYTHYYRDEHTHNIL